MLVRQVRNLEEKLTEYKQKYEKMPLEIQSKTEMVDQLLEKLSRFKTENQVLRSELERSSKEFREEFDYLKSQVKTDLEARSVAQKEQINRLKYQYDEEFTKSNNVIKTLKNDNKLLCDKIKRVKEAFSTNSSRKKAEKLLDKRFDVTEPLANKLRTLEITGTTQSSHRN